MGILPDRNSTGNVGLARVLPTETHCEQSGRRDRNYESGLHLLKTCVPTTPEGRETRPGWRFQRYAPGNWQWTITTGLSDTRWDSLRGDMSVAGA